MHVTGTFITLISRRRSEECVWLAEWQVYLATEHHAAPRLNTKTVLWWKVIQIMQ